MVGTSPTEARQVLVSDVGIRPRPTHIPSLDGLRGLAVLMVIGVHLEGSFLPRHHAFWHYTNSVLTHGWIGVDLFFVLSGFLITTILLNIRGARNRLSSFYGRRILRIFPLYYSVLIAAAVGVFLCFKFGIATRYLSLMAPTHKGWLSYFLYYQNWWQPVREPDRMLLNHFWSLAVEEQFYLLWPMVVWRCSERTLLKICIAGFCAAILFRFVVMHLTFIHGDIVFMNLFSRMDALLAGAFCSLLVRKQHLIERIKSLAPWLFAAGLLGILYLDKGLGELWTRGYYTHLVGFSLFSFTFSSLLLWAYTQDQSGSWLDRILRSPVLVAFGTYSYGLYLYHPFVNQASALMFHSRPWFARGSVQMVVFSVIMTTVSFAIAYLSFRYFENPILKLKRQFNPKFN